MIPKYYGSTIRKITVPKLSTIKMKIKLQYLKLLFKNIPQPTNFYATLKAPGIATYIMRIKHTYNC